MMANDPFVDLTTDELDAIEVLSRDEDNWPPEYRPAVPTIRDLVLRWRAERAAAPGYLSPEDIGRRIGAHL